MTQRVKDLGREQGRLSRDEARTDWPLLVLAVGFVVIHAVQVTAPGLPATAHRLLEALSWGIWPIFAVDLLARVWLAERRWLYLLTHPIDVVVVLLPALRPLRVLRIFAAGQALVSRGGRVSLLRSAQAIAIAAGLLVFIAALAALDAERDAPGTHTTTLADALWWAATTVTTVGYGDTFPITPAGRGVAAVLMATGIALFGVLTANLAALLVDQGASDDDSEGDSLAARLDRIEAQLAALTHSLTNSDRETAR